MQHTRPKRFTTALSASGKSSTALLGLAASAQLPPRFCAPWFSSVVGLTLLASAGLPSAASVCVSLSDTETFAGKSVAVCVPIEGSF